MPTSWQLSKEFRRPRCVGKNRRRALRKNPQRRAHLSKNIIIVTPRKPNSARRRVAWVRIFYSKRGRLEQKAVHFFAYLNGDSDKFEQYLLDHNPNMSEKPGNTQYLRKHSRVLIRGGRTQDLPGLKYKIMRNKNENKSALQPLWYIKKKRSKYGAPKIRKSNELKNMWKFHFRYH